MKDNKESSLIEAINNIEEKLDFITKHICRSNSTEIDSETVAVITATAHHIFGRNAAVRKVKLLK